MQSHRALETPGVLVHDVRVRCNEHEAESDENSENHQSGHAVAATYALRAGAWMA